LRHRPDDRRPCIADFLRRRHYLPPRARNGQGLWRGLIEAFFDGCDNRGNLFIDGYNTGGAVAVAELPKGSSPFVTMTLSNTVEFPGSVQWDGKYLTIEDQETSAIYGYACSGSSCGLKRTVSLTGAADCAGTWIAKTIVFCADAGNDDVAVYKYPAGGSSIATLTGTDFPLGVIQVTK
jgi:hypothetical protein